MKKILFASTAAAAMAVGGMAAAQGVTVFGDARLGLGYNVSSAGGALLEGDDADDNIRAVSRVRFGVRLTGETPTGITFGGTIRADNASGGTAGTAGNAFVSGIYGTLTMGDTASAHQQHVGDLPGIGLTALGDLNEFDYLGNRQGGDFRPTVRYDFDVAGFGVSVGSDNELGDIGVGASYAGQFAGGTFSIGAGYYDSEELDVDEWTAGLTAGFGGFTGQVIYLNRDDDEQLGVGLSTTFGEIGFNAFYREFLTGGGISELTDGDNAYGAGINFDLGGGASLRTGVARTFDGTTVGDLGINMAF